MNSVCSMHNCSWSNQSKPLPFAHRTRKWLLGFQSSISDFLRRLTEPYTAITGEIAGRGIAFMRKSRDGFTKEEAKKLFYSFRGGNKQDDDGGDDPERKPDPAADVVKAKTPDEKIDKIIDYMRVTSSKLDRIEDDIQSLKEQVDRILEKI